MDTFAMLQELLAQNQFELLVPEPVEEKTKKTEKTGHSFRLVYLMNDAVESFLIFRDARMTGHYKPDYEGGLEASLTQQDGEYVLAVRQKDSVFTIFFKELRANVRLYDYGKMAHFWIPGYEYLRQLEYRIAILSDKKEYLGQEYCTPGERKLAELVAFPPLNYCSYSAVPEKYMVPRTGPWEVTPEAIDVMEELAREAKDRKLLLELQKYRMDSSVRRAKRIAKMLHQTAHFKVVDLIAAKLAKETSTFPKREFDSEMEKRIHILYKKAELRQSELKKKGIRADILHEEPFTTAKDDLAYRVYLMLWKPGIVNQKITIEEVV